MNIWTLIADFFLSNQKHFIFFFCVGFGVLANESYHILKEESYQIKNILYKFIVALFVCLTIGQFFKNELYYPISIMILSFGYRPAIEFIIKDFLPFMLKKITNNNKSDE